MPARKTTTRKTPPKQPSEQDTTRREEAIERNKKKRQIYSIVLFASGLLIIAFSILGNVATAWDAIHRFLWGMFGLAVFTVGPVLIYASIMIARDKRKSAVIIKMLQLAAIILLLSGTVQIIGVGEVGSISEVYENGKNLIGGGVFGMILGFPLMFFGQVGGGIIIILIGFVFIMLMGNITLTTFLNITSKPFKKAGEFAKQKHEQHKQDVKYIEEVNKKCAEEEALMRLKAAEENIEKEIEKDTHFAGIMAVADSAANKPPVYITDEPVTAVPDIDMPFPEIPPPHEITEEHEDESSNVFNSVIENYKQEEQAEYDARELRENSFELSQSELNPVGEYHLPSIRLLDDIIEKRSEADIADELEANSTKLIETLKSFGVLTKIVGVVRGPSVTRYEIQPAPGVKISKITSLTDDIALNLAAAGVRMEAPIPGKSAVGVEVPNNTIDTVAIRELIDSAEFRGTDSNLGAVIGKAISGEIIISDIAKMPHLLIAGTTGSGKSVCVNSIIMSILFRSTPDEVRLIMIDPKSVEFMMYSGIPHLLAPVVTDPTKAAGTLKWAVNEMTRRYALFAENNVRDISGYNEAAEINDELVPMTKIVIFIDELADLMMTAAREVEGSICRLAQMARAAGMHLVIATQRPTVNVVTGLIKANIPSRIALKVASQVDSRTIIDTAGADKLLGKGDMLYAPIGAPKPIRVQGCWVSDKEVERVIGFIKDNFDLAYDESVIEEIERQAETVSDDSKERDSDDIDMEDDKLEEAIEAVIDGGKASTSYLQLKLKVGYGRAARLIDIMERMGVVGKFEGSKPREILMTRQDWLERKMNIGK
ncbi:MAG: DNA translocase FtsK [Oscillospiraceae bacterium]|nr:DNA translocase FtsK [Oscillospiraceae bacterium]